MAEKDVFRLTFKDLREKWMHRSAVRDTNVYVLVLGYQNMHLSTIDVQFFVHSNILL